MTAMMMNSSPLPVNQRTHTHRVLAYAGTKKAAAAERAGIAHAACVCTGLVLMGLGFAVCAIADLLGSSARPSLPCDLFQL
jgi:hypothetical protein